MCYLLVVVFSCVVLANKKVFVSRVRYDYCIVTVFLVEFYCGLGHI